MYKLYIFNKERLYEVKVYDYELNKWSISYSGTIFRCYEDALLLKNKISKLNNMNILDIYISLI